MSAVGSLHGFAREHRGLSRRALLLGTASVALAGGGLLAVFDRQISNRWIDFTTEIPSGSDTLSVAYRQARRRGKPLLVRLLWSRRPSDADADRREVFADLLRYGATHEVAPLALCEIVTLCFDELPNDRELSQLKKGADFLFIETTGRRMEVKPLSIPSIEIRMPPPRVQRRRTYFCGMMSAEERAQAAKEEEEYLQAVQAEQEPYLWAQRQLRLHGLAQLLASAVSPHLEWLARRARDAQAALSSREEELVMQALARREAPDSLLCPKAAALVALAAAQIPDAALKERYLAALAASVGERWK